MTSKVHGHDGGAILPLVLVVVVVLGAVMAALATYASGALRYGQVVEASADRLSAAQGAMDNALEDIERGSSGCVTETVEQGTSYTYSMATSINGITPTVSCTVFDGDVTPIDAYAVIMTGAGGQSGPLLTITGAVSDPKEFGGNIYMEGVPDVDSTIDLSSKLFVKDGNLKYHSDSDPSCSTAPDLVVGPSKELTLSPGFLTVCDPNEGWERFLPLRPVQPDVASFPTRDDTPSEVTTSGCNVWLPGRYESAPQLVQNSAHYFSSGEYYFDDIGTWEIDSSWVLAGWPGASGPDIVTNKVLGSGMPDLGDPVADRCRGKWENPDEPHTGAAFYMGGTSQIMIGQNASLEIAGSVRNGYNVGLYALEGGAVRSDLTGEDRIVQTGSGNKKQLAIHGLVWAPYTGLEFSNIANQTVAALTGGAVVSELEAGAAANTDGFLISVETQPAVLSFVVTSTATNKGTTAVRTQLLYRSDGSTHEYAILSRRILGLTPE